MTAISDTVPFARPRRAMPALRLSPRLAKAFAAEEGKGLRLSFRIRMTALVLVALLLLVINPWPQVLYYYALMLGFVATAWLSLIRAKNEDCPAGWTRWLVPPLDLALVTFALVYPNPWGGDEWLTYPERLGLNNVLFPLLFITLSTLSYSPRQVLLTGASAAVWWVVATMWMIGRPGVKFGWGFGGVWSSLDRVQQLAIVADPNVVAAIAVFKVLALMLIITAILAAAAQRARMLVLRQVQAAAERAQLARYVSANLVDQLADADRPLGAIRQAELAVLFVDIVGFTHFAEARPPEAVIGLLRTFHARMQSAVFAHRGTLDKYLGDGLMATFGTPLPGPRDAGDALAAARDMVDSMGRWNDERRRDGEAPIRIGVGIHWGPAVMGDIGGENRLEFATIGDTVNVASRLEALTRTLDADVIVSSDLVRMLRATVPAAEAEDLLAGFAAAEPQMLRGRDAPIEIYVLRSRAAVAA
jgi:adenylate cyclase